MVIDTNIETPETYSFSRDGASTISFTGQTTRIAMAGELISAMQDFDETEEGLKEMFANEAADGSDVNPWSDDDLNASTKSIKSKVAASEDLFASNTALSAKIRSDFETWIAGQVDEVFPNQMELAEAGKAGQIADGSSVRYVNALGLEYNQAVNKGLIGALMLDQIVNNYLSTSVLDAASNRDDNEMGVTAEAKPYTTMEHKWDEAYGYLFGGASSAAEPLMTLGGDDAFLNKYVSRVNDDPDFATIGQDIFDAFKLGRAAIVAKNYTVRDEQASILRALLSKVIGVRAVYYLQQGKNALPAGGRDYGATFHDLSEGYGFVYSLQFTREPDGSSPYFSSSEVDDFLSQLLAGNGFWEVTPEILDQMSEEIASRFDFTVAQAGN